MKKRLTRPRELRPREAIKGVSTVEYVLVMTPRYNERKNRTVIYIALRTVKEFRHFRYDIVVEHSLEGRRLRFDIQGLRAPELTFAGVGPAIFETEYDNLSGKYEVVVTKLRKEVNRFHVNISPGSVLVEKVPGAKFVNLINRMEVL